MKSDQEAIKILKGKKIKIPELAIILGSGWNQVVKEAIVEAEIGYDEMFGVKATVPGHEGKLVIASLSNKRVAFLQGRFHMYEGFSAYEATAPIRVLHALGLKRLITTAAAGAINEHYRVGEFVILQDLITMFLSFDPPLTGAQFADLSCVFDDDLRAVARRSAINLNIPTQQEGVYCYLHGPNFETPADKMALKILGADVVGMSTVPEVMMARWLKIKVLGLALVTNLAFVKHDHKDVLAEAEKAAGRMVKWLKGIVALV